MENQAVNPMSLFPYDQHQDEPSTIRFQLDSKDIIKDLEMTLKNVKYNMQGKLVPNGRPLMNDEGISEILTILRSVLTKNTYLSNVGEDQVNKEIISFSDDIIDLLGSKFMEFEVDKNNISLIHNIFTETIAFALRRPMNQGERVFLRPTRRVIENVTTQKTEGGGSVLNLWKK